MTVSKLFFLSLATILLIRGVTAVPTPTPPSTASQGIPRLAAGGDAQDLPEKYLAYIAGDIPTSDSSASVSSLALPGFRRTRGAPALAADDAVLTRIKDVAPFASVPYCGEAETLMQLDCGPKCQLPQVRESRMIRVIEQDSNLVVIADRPDKNEVVVSFRGTANDANWLDNLELNRIPWPFNQPAANSSSSFTVHKGFTDAYRTVRNETLATVQEQLAGNPNRTLLVSGHSLGGAIAAMAALDMVAGRMIDASRVDLVTYGTPRIGDRGFASVMGGVGFRMMQRVVSGRDLIPHVPAQATGYQQLDGELFIKATSDGNAGDAEVSACRGKEDPTCSNARVPFLCVQAHGQFLSGASFFGQDGCRTDTAD